MCNSDPRREKQTLWGFTEEEISRRWKVHSEFDPINRLFGSKENEKPDVPRINPASIISSLESLLPQG